MKTPEELAEEYTKDWWGNLPEAEGMRKSAKENFLAGYQAAKDQLFEETGFRLKLVKDEDDARVAYQEALEEIDLDKAWQEGYQAAQDHNADASKMVWISVKDRLPKEDQEVLMYDGIFILTCLFWKSRKLAFQWELSSGIICNPTHWMPLPKPPEE